MDIALVCRDCPRHNVGCELLLLTVRLLLRVVEQCSDICRWEYSPRSMVGGDLHWIWTPYSIYQEVDLVRREILVFTMNLLTALFYRYME